MYTKNYRSATTPLNGIIFHLEGASHRRSSGWSLFFQTIFYGVMLVAAASYLLG